MRTLPHDGSIRIVNAMRRMPRDPDPGRPARALLLHALLAAAFGTGAGCGRPAAPAPQTQPPATHKTASGIEMILVPAGSFDMGNAGGKDDEAPVHRLRLDAFLMDRTEVTQDEFARLELPDPSHFKGARLPVEQVNWPQAALFCNRRSEAEGLAPCYDEATGACDFDAPGYRLPTEAEWEYACRAGTKSQYPTGDDPAGLGAHAWFNANAAGKTHPVAIKRPNAWGLHDMCGNVAEWCNDIYDAHQYARSTDTNPRGPTQGDRYTLRGGAWASPADALRSSARMAERAGFADACLARDAIGFRCVRRAPGTDLPAAQAPR